MSSQRHTVISSYTPGNCLGVNPFYNGVLYSLRKKGLSLFRLAKYDKLRLTWFRKLGLVDPPNSDNVRVCSEQFTEDGFIVDMQTAMGSRR